jgi:hypothetical protein
VSKKLTKQERVERANTRYAEAVLDGQPGMAAFQLARMQEATKQTCCTPYKGSRHTATCPTVTHAVAFLDPSGTLTECGIVGPISDTPNCEKCLRLPPLR